MKKITLEADFSNPFSIETIFKVVGTADSGEISQAMLALIQRIIYEWLQGGMETKDCYNLILFAARKAEELYNGER